MESAKNLIKTPEIFFKETFKDTIEQYGEENAFFIGKKMYLRIEENILSVDFIGPSATASNQLALTLIRKEGPIEQNISPLSSILRETKIKTGTEKVVTFKMFVNQTGEYTMMWNAPLSKEDYMKLNNAVISFIELFSTL